MVKGRAGKKAPSGMAGRPFRADLHVHTHRSIDSLAKPEDVVRSAVKGGMSAIAVTDHNEVAGAYEAQRFARRERLPIQVIIGEEVSTDRGDLLVYFLKNRIPAGPLKRVLSEVKRQNAVCSCAHPYDWSRHGIKMDRLPKAELSCIGAIEVLNARAGSGEQNARALEFATRAGKAQLAGSD